jgi:GT2 family glycosyltransferase
VIVVDNDSGNDVPPILNAMLDRITYIRTGTNLGFSGGTNVGIRESLLRGADRVLLVNSDVIVPPDAIGKLEACLDGSAHAGIAGPVVLARSEPDRIASLGMAYIPSTGRMRHRSNGMRLSELPPLEPGAAVDGVSGCLMLIKREVFEAVGLFDESFFFSFEDLDFCLRARRAGFETRLAGEAVIYHEGGQSIGAESPRRLYFAARNHLLLAKRADPSAGRLSAGMRGASILMLNVAHAFMARGGPLPVRLGAVAAGTRDYVRGRFGSGL